MVQRARTNLKGARPRPRMRRFLEVNCQALPFISERFDTVLAIGLLDLVPDLDRALNEARRVLRPDGQFIATAGGKGHLQELETLLQPFLPDKIVQCLGGQEDRFGLDNGEQLLSPYFKKIVRRDYNDQLVFTELSPVLDYILSEQEIAWSMPLSRLDEFFHHVKRELAQSGQIAVTVRKGVFVARKTVNE
jgi:ubiquinone/menaquinone biosynthesis C-methylase UbiE